jgi:hypothetical protein
MATVCCTIPAPRGQAFNRARRPIPDCVHDLFAHAGACGHGDENSHAIATLFSHDAFRGASQVMSELAPIAARPVEGGLRAIDPSPGRARGSKMGRCTIT